MVGASGKTGHGSGTLSASRAETLSGTFLCPQDCVLHGIHPSVRDQIGKKGKSRQADVLVDSNWMSAWMVGWMDGWIDMGMSKWACGSVGKYMNGGWMNVAGLETVRSV